jgi:hypothetical protein
MLILIIFSLKKIGVITHLLPKFLSNKSPYNYYDYIDAWSKFFLYQIPSSDHSWFVMFDKGNSIRFLPLWFSRWWMHFGLIPDILPLQLVESFSLFRNHAKTDAYGSKFASILHFSKKYNVPWILKWQYVIVGDKLERHWYIKWWDKFQFDDIVENVKEFCRIPKTLDLPKPTIQNLPSNSTQKLPANAPPALLTPNDFLPPVKQESPPASSSSSKKKTSLSKKKKKALMKAFLESFDIGSDDDDIGSAKCVRTQITARAGWACVRPLLMRATVGAFERTQVRSNALGRN